MLPTVQSVRDVKLGSENVLAAGRRAHLRGPGLMPSTRDANDWTGNRIATSAKRCGEGGLAVGQEEAGEMNGSGSGFAPPYRYRFRRGDEKTVRRCCENSAKLQLGRMPPATQFENLQVGTSL